MRGEIDSNFYCASLIWDWPEERGPKCVTGVSFEADTHKTCQCRHRKWPTLKEYREEYGEAYPEGAALYVKLDKDDNDTPWQIASNFNGMYSNLDSSIDLDYIVCACTPFGKPPDGWRPE